MVKRSPNQPRHRSKNSCGVLIFPISDKENRVFDRGDILSIDDYVKYIILNFQNKFPDTELSKKLGISRKSLWEKRKKYGITKKK